MRERLNTARGLRDVALACGVQGAGFRVQGSGCRVKGAGCRVQGARCRVQGSGFDALRFKGLLG